uniref:PDZ domain-containing protein n=1 Tax=Biomphalaria glabrata TaxID=6526 RepID=A0A2C9LD73_BIOGL
MADARHDQAVALLTGLDRTIKLVVYREKIVPKGEGSEPPPPGSQRIPNITQPVINWQQSSTPPARTPSPVGAQLPPRLSPSSAGAVSYQAPTVSLTSVSSPLSPAGRASGSSPSFGSPNRYSGIEAGPTMSPPSPFSAAVPTSYSYLNQPAAPSPTGQTSPSPISPKFGAKTISTDWSVPPTSVQPPKFVYPGFSKAPSATTSATISIASAPSISIPPPSPSVQTPSARNSTSLPPSQTLTMPVPAQVSRSSSASLNRASTGDIGVSKVLNMPTMSIETPDDSPESNHVELRSHSPQPYPVEDITIVKAGGPLGLSIVGGVDHSSQPFGGDEPGVFVSKIVKDGAASKTSLRIGDRILSVNNKDLKHATHEEAVMALISPTYEIHLKVRHDPPPPGLQELTIVKEASEKLGLSIKGGAKNLATPNRSDEGIFISRINEDGAASRDGRLRAGQRILEVNGTSLLGATHQEAVRALRSVGDKMTILVCDQPPEKSETNSPAELSSPSSQGGFLSSLHGSVSSIDRDDEEARIMQQELEMMKETEQWELEQKSANQSVMNNQVPLKPPVAEKPLNSLGHVKRPEPQLSAAPVLTAPRSFSTTSTAAEATNPPPVLLGPKPFPLSPRPAPFSKPSTLNNSQPPSEPTVPRPVVLPKPVPFAPPPKIAPKPVFKPSVSPVKHEAQDGGDVSSPISPPETFDVRKSARVPSGYILKAATNAEIEKMSFREKQKYFEKEIKDAPATRPAAKQFSYLSEHEVAMLRQEEAKKVGGMSQAEILSYVTGGTGDITPDHDLDQVLSRGVTPKESSDGIIARQREAEKRASYRRARMKSLEADAVQAQAVIAKAQELSKDSNKANRLQTVAFADEDQPNHPNHNGDSRLEGVRQQLQGVRLAENKH